MLWRDLTGGKAVQDVTMDSQALLRLQYAAAIACGVFAALAVHILLTVSGYGLGSVLRDLFPTAAQQMLSSLAWWAIGAAGFTAGWGAGAYLIAAAREREFIYLIARRTLVVLVLAVCTAAGVLSKTGSTGGGADVLANLTALGLALLSAYCGARLAYLNAEPS
jgi:hypothetical protein